MEINVKLMKVIKQLKIPEIYKHKYATVKQNKNYTEKQ